MPPQFQPLRDAAKQAARGYVVSASSVQTFLYQVERKSDLLRYFKLSNTQYREDER